MRPTKALSQYDYLLVFDIETTGLNHYEDDIIEFGGVLVETKNNQFTIKETLPYFVNTHRVVPEKILQLTNITLDQIKSGISQRELASILCEYAKMNVLWVAYNTQFDISFIDTLLNKCHPSIKFKPDILDLMAVYKDRFDYPHKLDAAMAQYNIISEGHHRAIYDAKVTFELLLKLDEALPISPYINVIGYNPKYGLSGVVYPHIKYLEHPYDKGSLLKQILH